ncbi:MAG: endolytic transglycosylase MltG, partial [Tardiphaga sp.]
TIIYGIVGGKGTLGRPIKRSEITQPSPYNTYVVEGLPPGPIANPGRASMEATAKPARTRDLFFVADGTGGHSFTETYDAHQKNVARLRMLEKQIQNDTVEPPEEAAAPAAAAVPADPNAAGATSGKPAAPAKRTRAATPPPARQGAAQSATPPVVPQ